MNNSLIFRTKIVLILLILSFSLFAQGTDTISEEEPIINLDDEIVFNLEDEAEEELLTTEENGNFVPVWEYIRMLIVLACVVVVIYLFFFFLKKGMKKKMPENDFIKVITTTALQGNDLLYLIQIGFHFYVVGSGGNGLSLITQIADKETIDTIMLKVSEESPREKQNFSDILLKIFSPGKKREGLLSNPINFMKKQQERLDKLK